MGNITDTIRDEIHRRGLTYAAAARLADLDPAQVRRFVLGERGLTSEALDKLAEAMGLRLVAQRPDPEASDIREAEEMLWRLKIEYEGLICEFDKMIKRTTSLRNLAERYKPENGPRIDRTELPHFMETPPIKDVDAEPGLPSSNPPDDNSGHGILDRSSSSD